MEKIFQGKRALVTGAGKGIGRALAVKLVSLGADVIGLSRTQSDLDNLKAEWGNTFNTSKAASIRERVKCPSLEVCLLDIEDWDTTREIVEKLGHIDLLVNNAAVSNHVPFLEVTKEDFDRTQAINFKAVYNITQVVARRLVAKGTGGAIVNVSSIAGMKAITNQTNYCTSKAALDMLTQTLALELGPHKIRVNSVSPTLVLTPMGKQIIQDVPGFLDKFITKTPLGKVAEVEDVVNAIVFLLSDQASMINGVIMPVDGGITVQCLS